MPWVPRSIRRSAVLSPNRRGSRRTLGWGDLGLAPVAADAEGHTPRGGHGSRLREHHATRRQRVQKGQERGRTPGEERSAQGPSRRGERTPPGCSTVGDANPGPPWSCGSGTSRAHRPGVGIDGSTQSSDPPLGGAPIRWPRRHQPSGPYCSPSRPQPPGRSTLPGGGRAVTTGTAGPLSAFPHRPKGTSSHARSPITRVVCVLAAEHLGPDASRAHGHIGIPMPRSGQASGRVAMYPVRGRAEAPSPSGRPAFPSGQRAWERGVMPRGARRSQEPLSATA